MNTGVVTTLSERRLAHLRLACKNYDKQDVRLTPRFLVDEGHHVINCEVLKAGSTTMLALVGKILEDQNKDDTLSPLDTTRRVNVADLVKFGVDRFVVSQFWVIKHAKKKIDRRLKLLKIKIWLSLEYCLQSRQ